VFFVALLLTEPVSVPDSAARAANARKKAAETNRQRANVRGVTKAD
jgi:hypothetical protein